MHPAVSIDILTRNSYFLIMRTTRLYLLLLLCCGPIMSFGQSDGLLTNPTFKDGLEPWKFAFAPEYKGKSTPPSIAPAGGSRKMPECVIQTPHSSSWHYYRIQQPVELVNGQTYKVTLEAKYREGPGTLRIATWSSGIQKNNGLSMSLPVDQHWQRYEVTFKARFVDESETPSFIFGTGETKGMVTARNFSFSEYSEEVAKGQQLKTTALEDPSRTAAIKTVSVDAQQIIDDFAANINGAKKKYAGRNLNLSAAVTGVDKGARPGTYELALLDGGIRITVGGSQFDDQAYEKLQGAIRTIRRNIKDEQKEKKALWGKLDREDRLKKEFTYYPTVNCIARIHNYRNRMVEIQQTKDLLIAYPSK